MLGEAKEAKKMAALKEAGKVALGMACGVTWGERNGVQVVFARRGGGLGAFRAIAARGFGGG